MKTITYQVLGMTCANCEATVTTALAAVPGVTAVSVSREAKTATLTVQQPIEVATLQAALSNKYQLSALPPTPSPVAASATDERTWLETYRPILLIFGYITLVTLLIQWTRPAFDTTEWMRHFMAGFFLVFSFFKLLNLQGFAQSYQMYDVIARRLPIWAYVYAFIELGLGVAYLLNFNPFVTNIVTAVVMSVSLIGVLQTVLNKRAIQCACLGAIFNLPMSTVTIIEDGLMILMSVAMLLGW